MSALVARSPLQPLNMSAAQRSKRKPVARANLDDDDVLPAKKKARVQAETDTINAKPAGRTRRTRQVYDEEVDGFTFRRKTRKETQAEATTAAEPAPAPALKPKPSAQRTRESISKSSDIPVTTRRRSARLSADQESSLPEPQKLSPKPRKQRKPAAKVAEPPIESRDEELSGASAKQELRVSKSRKNGTTIALPFADTPVIKRNKEMRAAHGGRNSSQNRRSSTGTRGRRASSLIDSGTSNAVPHADVHAGDFYKLIEQGLPERKRMRNLLIWCGTRALLEKPRGSTDKTTLETIAIESARQIQEELIKDFSSKEELSDWWSREDDPAASIPKKPNPRNVRNQEKLQELEDEIKRLEVEEKSWKSLIPKHKAPIPEAQSDSTLLIDSTLLSESQRALLSSLAVPNTTSTETAQSSSAQAISQRLQTMTSRFEPTVDAFTDGIHRLTVYTSSAGRIADRIKAIWAGKLDRRDEQAKTQHGSADVASRDLLRALAGKLNER